MSTLDSIASITIDLQTQGVTRKSFGIPCVIGRHDAFTELAQEYNLTTALADLVTDGIAVGTPIYRAVADLAANTKRPEKVVVGRLTTSYTQKFTITVNSTEENQVFAFSVISPDGGITTPVTYTALLADTTTDVAVALSALVDAITDVSEDVTPPTTATMAFTADNADEKWYISGIDERYLTFKDTTVDSSLVTDLTAIRGVNDTWYGLLLADPNSSVRVAAIAASILSAGDEKMFGYTSHDGEVGTDTSGEIEADQDIMYRLNQATNLRTLGLYSANQGHQATATWLGLMLTKDPGSATWAYKTLPGISVDNMTAGFLGYVNGKAGNWYEEIAGVNVTQTGKMGSGEWADVIRGRDWLVARLRERLASLLFNNDKIPYTDSGIAAVANQVEAQMREGITQGYIAASPAPVVTVPKVADIDADTPADKIERILRNVYFQATLQGAIHKMVVNGVLQS